MNLRDLQYLVAVADHQHFGRAADACYVSQPALSMQLKKLEDTLGVQLIERTNKKVMVTAIGQEIVARARQILQEAEEIKEVAKAHQNPLAGDIKLGAFPTLAPYFFPQIVPEVRKKLPDLKLFLVEEKTDILLKKLKAGEIDAAFLALPLPIEEDGLEIRQLFDDPFFLAVPKGHPLAVKKSVDPSDILGKQLLLLEDGHCLRSQALSFCHIIGVEEHQNFRATSLETLRQMVASGVGITLMPALAIREHDDIGFIPFSSPAPLRTVALVWRKTSARTVCFQAIEQVVLKLMS